MFTTKRILTALGLVLLAAVWCAADWWMAIPRDAVATYVGRESCAKCHETELHRWTGSHHDRAMELATEENVLGDFDDFVYERFGVESRFFRRDGKFWVNTEGPDGEFQDFEIKYTFGIEPMQQYMVEFPDGRVQVLRISWDTRKDEWFYVYPTDVVDERILPGDPLHWTGIGQNWNTMCAECHSTNVKKNFNLAANTYDTTFSEIDVSCETCHGPASLHVELAESNSLFWDRNHGYGLAKLKGEANDSEIDTCAPCHSRRSPLHVEFEGGDRYLDYYQPQLVRQGLYHSDGQILDEVYVYGSFMQSRMYREGVRCSDCHDSHSLKLKFQGNQLCTNECHTEGKYDGYAHHRHKDAEATSCVVCHMPHETYMVIDDRRDHSIRVPRPDLSVKYGTPNVCNSCHTMPGEDAEWAAEKIREWYGDKRPDDPHYAHALVAGEQGEADGLEKLRAVLRRKEAPAIIRATALQLTANYPASETDRITRQFIDDKDPLVRAAALEAMSSNAVKNNLIEVSERLHDPRRIVRFAAAQRLVREASVLKDERSRKALDKAVVEYEEAQNIMAERAASHINLSRLYKDLNDNEKAAESLRTAIRLEPYLSNVRSELALLLSESGGDEQEVLRLRREEIELMERDAKLFPGNSTPHYSKGLLEIFVKEYEEAQKSFAKAAELEPNRYENWFYLAIVSQELKDWEEAQRAFEVTCRMRPDEYQNWVWLALACEQQKDWTRALEVLGEMYARQPKDPTIRVILQRIQASGGITPEMLQEAAEEKKKLKEQSS